MNLPILVHDTPGIKEDNSLLGINQAAGCCQLHGNLTPPRISPSRPHCEFLLPAGLWLDGSIIVSVTCHRHIESNSILTCRHYSLSAQQFGTINIFPLLMLVLAHRWCGWRFDTSVTGLYLMNVYSIQGSLKELHSPSDYHVGEKLSFHLFGQRTPLWTPYLKNFFNFFIDWLSDFTTLLWLVPSSRAISWVLFSSTK